MRKKVAKSKISYSKKPSFKWVIFFIIGLGLGIILFLIFLFLKKPQKHIAQALVNPINKKVYYDQQAFKEPKGLVKGASSSRTKLKIPIIMYHYVEYVKDTNDTIRKSLSVTPSSFQKELEALNENHYQTFFLKDVPDILNGKINYSTYSAILTFDDGYEDFYTDAFPLLKRYQVKSTIFIINNYIGRKGFLNKSQIQELIDSNLVEIGSHTLNHVYLKTASEKLAQKEIVESKLDLEKTFGISVKTFAYPFGAFSQQTIDLIKGATFSAAVSVLPGSLQNEENLFYLSRIRSGMFSGGNITRVLESYKK